VTAPAASRPPILEGTTPGPWRAICIGRVWHVSDTGEDFPIVTTMMENREANARLIASAPDLALLLAEAVEFYYGVDGEDDNHEPGKHVDCGSCDFIRRAERALGGGK
jgi:hypothetical protein